MDADPRPAPELDLRETEGCPDQRVGEQGDGVEAEDGGECQANLFLLRLEDRGDRSDGTRPTDRRADTDQERRPVDQTECPSEVPRNRHRHDHCDRRDADGLQADVCNGSQVDACAEQDHGELECTLQQEGRHLIVERDSVASEVHHQQAEDERDHHGIDPVDQRTDHLRHRAECEHENRRRYETE